MMPPSYDEVMAAAPRNPYPLLTAPPPPPPTAMTQNLTVNIG